MIISPLSWKSKEAWLSAVVILLVVAALWATGLASTSKIKSRLEAARVNNQRELAALKTERDRYRAELAAKGRSTNAPDDLAEFERLQSEIAAREQAALPAGKDKLQLGEWRPAASWKNSGKSTPKATLQTALWAAAGGDIDVLQSTLSLDSDSRAKLADLIGNLPEPARREFPTPESFVAGVTLRNIPVGEAQLVWYREQSEDEAIVCLILNKLDDGPIEAPPATATAASEKPPPTHIDNGKSRMAFLSLKKSGPEWHLVVPPGAVEKMVAEFGRTAAK